MPTAKLKLSAEMLRAYFLGGLDAAIVGAWWSEEFGAVIVEVEGSDVPTTDKLLRVETITYSDSRFVEVRPKALGSVQTVIRAKMIDGSAVEITREDKGDSVPGFDANKNVYEAFTTRFYSDKFGEVFSQVDKQFTLQQKDPIAFRFSEDLGILSSLDVDIATLEFS